MTKISGYVPNSFRDAGTGEFFEGGKDHQFEPGAHANYVAGGKIGEKPAATADKTKAADKTA